MRVGVRKIEGCEDVAVFAPGPSRAGAGKPVVTWRGTPDSPGRTGRAVSRPCAESRRMPGFNRAVADGLCRHPRRHACTCPRNRPADRHGGPASSVRPARYGLTVQPRTRHGSRRPSSGKLTVDHGPVAFRYGIGTPAIVPGLMGSRVGGEGGCVFRRAKQPQLALVSDTV